VVEERYEYDDPSPWTALFAEPGCVCRTRAKARDMARQRAAYKYGCPATSFVVKYRVVKYVRAEEVERG
jgi:hypothetical protein